MYVNTNTDKGNWTYLINQTNFLSSLRCAAVEPADSISHSRWCPGFSPAAAQTDVPERGRRRGRHPGEEEELHLLSDCPHHEAGEGDAHRQPRLQGWRKFLRLSQTDADVETSEKDFYFIRFK